MEITQIVYKGSKPKPSELDELRGLIPQLDIELTPLADKRITTALDPLYNVMRLDWDWFSTLFKDVDVRCLVLERGDLKGVGVTQHWGWYSLDKDTNHQFYLTNLKGTLERRARLNGFKSNFVWMFCHEYLHGCVWAETRDKYKAAQIVHDWEQQGILKQELARYVAQYQKLSLLASLLRKLYNLVRPNP